MCIYSGINLAGIKKWDKEKPRGGTLRGVVVGSPRFASWHISEVERVALGGGGTEPAGTPRPAGRLEGLVEAGLGWLLTSSCGVGNSDSTHWRFTYAFLSAQDVWRIHQLREHL